MTAGVGSTGRHGDFLTLTHAHVCAHPDLIEKANIGNRRQLQMQVQMFFYVLRLCYASLSCLVSPSAFVYAPGMSTVVPL